MPGAMSVKMLIAFKVSFIRDRVLFTFYMAAHLQNALAAGEIERINLKSMK